ncbi:hypothetical protein ACIL2K_002628 [Vibrio vulnificus]|uniref:hypothetical protein n=1 Tax=Vibrio parahaemolyticus TaxID=670 RepID=UPI00084A84D2|nr:hypothetical protein [Vibrio parahaemolyticus]EHR1009001.1 hypothetical protein [Vibrio parahaemolyticus]MBM4843452.1 hypothetical protein [Vibrio parahaemolyticus]ODX39658.1 hypothetical protein BBM01_00845 [Vibrio parahaemolyticus]
MINEVEIAEGAYFYKKNNSKTISDTAIKNIFINISRDRMTTSHTVKLEREDININGNDSKYSICVFKQKFKPSILKSYSSQEYEIKFCYILILEYLDYIVISKKNVKSNSDLEKYLDDIDYSILSKLYADEQSKFHKLQLDNLDVSSLALRSKSIEALELKNSFSTFGANNYAIRNMRVTSNGQLYSLSLGTSRINKHSGKVDVISFLNWIGSVCDDISKFKSSSSFVDSFATPISFENKINSLTPKGVLFKLGDISEQIEQGLITKVTYNYDSITSNLKLEKYISKYDRALEVFPNKVGYCLSSPVNRLLFDAMKIELKVLKKSIKIKSNTFRNIDLHYSTGETVSLEEYINKNSGFVVTFDDPYVAYHSKKLFENSALLSNISAFMSIFEPYPQLSNVKSEKGKFSSSSTQFSSDSIFNKVETVVNTTSPYMFLDDLGNEWADHIAVSDGVIEFYHSKHGKNGLSASKFQDVVGQAQKNLGNLVPHPNRLVEKEKKWKCNFKIKDSNNKSIQTSIKRIRKIPNGENIADGIKYYNEQLQNPNLRKVVYLVVNFISKVNLQNSLEALKQGHSLQRKNEVVQILWFISSLICSCKEQGVEIRILCLP